MRLQVVYRPTQVVEREVHRRERIMRTELTRHLDQKLPGTTAAEAETAAAASIAAMYGLIPKDDVLALVEAAELATDRADLERSPSADEGAYYAAVAERLGVDDRVAREVSRTVISALPRVTSPSLKKRLRHHLPEALGSLLDEAHPLARPDAGPGPLPEDEAPPVPPVDVARAHEHSVVRARNPHEKTKISSGRKSPDVRGGTIATGRPTSERPLVDWGEEP